MVETARRESRRVEAPVINELIAEAPVSTAEPAVRGQQRPATTGAPADNPADRDFPDEAAYRGREARAVVAAVQAAPSYPVTTAEIAFGVISVVAWLLLFVAGTVVGTADFRTALGAGRLASASEVITAILTVLTCYTITNVAFLAVLAAVAGEFSARSRVSSLTISIRRDDDATPHLRDVLACYSAAGMRGFVIYLLFIAGLLLVTTDAVANADQGQYVRLAGLLSVVSFAAGYDAELFRRAIDRVVSLVSQGKLEGSPAAKGRDSVRP
jgi:hypothetical protein